MRSMCHDCPHKREHEVGDEFVFFPEYKDTPHPCHNAIQLPCVGHQLQHAKVYRKEDFENARTFIIDFVRGG